MNDSSRMLTLCQVHNCLRCGTVPTFTTLGRPWGFLCAEHALLLVTGRVFKDDDSIPIAEVTSIPVQGAFAEQMRTIRREATVRKRARRSNPPRGSGDGT
jgi:hypothetical protein